MGEVGSIHRFPTGIFVQPSASFQLRRAESLVHSAVNLQPSNAVKRFWSHSLRRETADAHDSGQLLTLQLIYQQQQSG